VATDTLDISETPDLLGGPAVADALGVGLEDVVALPSFL
jgi:hypothetical protein